MRKFTQWLVQPVVDIFDPPYKVAFGEDPAEQIDKKVLYVIGIKNEPWQVEFGCPCGCGDKIILPVNNQTRPRWNIKIDKNGIPTLSPSIWRTKGCKSHFFLRKGRIQWCPDYERA